MVDLSAGPKRCRLTRPARASALQRATSFTARAGYRPQRSPAILTDQRADDIAVLDATAANRRTSSTEFPATRGRVGSAAQRLSLLTWEARNVRVR